MCFILFQLIRKFRSYALYNLISKLNVIFHEENDILIYNESRAVIVSSCQYIGLFSFPEFRFCLCCLDKFSTSYFVLIENYKLKIFHIKLHICWCISYRFIKFHSIWICNFGLKLQSLILSIFTKRFYML